MVRDYEKWIRDKIRNKEGQGHFKEYKPWLDFKAPLKSNKNFVEGATVRRNYYLASDLEERVFNILDFQEEAIDIQEQVPLLSRDITREIAYKIGVKHPVYPGSEVDVVMTTDLLFTYYHNGIIEKVAYSVKPSQELEKRRVIEKLAIEREYWRLKGIPYQIMTECDIDMVLVDNLDILASSRFIEMIPGVESFSTEERNDLLEDLTVRVIRSQDSLRDTASSFETDHNLERGTGIMLIKYLIYHKRLKTDLEKPLDFNRKWYPV